MCECKSEARENVKHSVGVAGVAPAPRPNQERRRRTQTQPMGFWWTSCLTVFATALIVAWIPNLLSPEPPKGNVEGAVDPQFKKVEDLFRLVD